MTNPSQRSQPHDGGLHADTKQPSAVRPWIGLFLLCAIVGVVGLLRYGPWDRSPAHGGLDSSRSRLDHEVHPVQAPGQRFQPIVVIPKAFPPITTFPVVRVQDVTGSKAKFRLRDNELVLGVTVGKESRAYPINMLTGPSREIINDQLGGLPIAATW